MAKRDGEAYPGDTYIADLRISAKSKKHWLKYLTGVIALAAIADFYFMQDTLALVMNWPALDSLEDVISKFGKGQIGEGMGNLIPILLTFLTAASMVFTYLYIGRIAGKKLKEYRAFGRNACKVEFYIALIVELIALVGFTYLRYSGELANPYSENPVIETLMMTLIMLVAAFLQLFYCYYSGSSVAGECLESATANLSEDRALYFQTFITHAVNPEKERSYEQRERTIDAEAIRSAFKLGTLASQLNGIVDPADAYEFREVSRMAQESYYGSNSAGRN